MSNQGMIPPVNGPYVPFHNYDGYEWGPIPAAPDRLNQGPFSVFQDAGWHTLMVTSPAKGAVRNFGMGLVGYAHEEQGPPPVEGETMAESVTKLARLPFVDKLYIRCDWRDVQSAPGRLDLNPVFPLALALSKELGLGVGMRIQMSNTAVFPELAVPEFLHDKIPFVEIGPAPYHTKQGKWREPDYTAGAFQEAFRELNELLAAEFDDDPLVEWVDLFQYGYWGEGHTGPTPATAIADYATLQETFLAMTRLQLDTWRKTPLAVNTQPDISRAGNDAVIDMAIRGGSWLRTDSIVSIEESQQIEMHANRPPFLASIVEDGGQRRYEMAELEKTMEDGMTVREYAALHALDVGANYWSLWQMADNLAAFNERWPDCFATMEEKIGYRVRPAWIQRRKRYGRIELIIILKNDGVAGVPGSLKIWVESRDGKVKLGGSLDPGHPLPGKLRHASILLPEGVDYEGLSLRAEIETKGVVRPVRWACREAVSEDGSLPLAPQKFTRMDWRKDM